MNEFTITPFRGPHLLLLLLTATAVLLIFLLLRGKPEARRSRYLIGVCFFNLALFAGYPLPWPATMEMDQIPVEILSQIRWAAATLALLTVPRFLFPC